MKLLIVSNDENIKNKFEETGYFDVAQQSNLHLLTYSAPKILLISDQIINHNELIDKLNSFTGISHIFYMISNVKKENETIKVICSSNNINVLEPTLTDDELVIEVIRATSVTNANKENNIFLFLGADHKVGTTSIVHATAQNLVQCTNKKVMVLSLSNRSNEQFVESNDNTIDSLRLKMSSKVLTFKDVLEASWNDKNFYFLPGPKDMLSIRKYELGDVNFLLDLLVSQKDFIFLVDAGCELDNPLTIAALQRIKNRNLISSTLPSELNHVLQVEKQILKKSVLNLSLSEFLLILNKYDDIEDPEPSKIAEAYHATLLGTFPIISYGAAAERKRKPLNLFNQNFDEKATAIAKVLSTKSGTDFKMKETKRSGTLQKIIGAIKGE